MAAGTYTAPNGEVYVDKKRHAWMISLLIPALAMAGPLLFNQTGNELFLWMFIGFWYLLFPVIDILMGEDRSNPPESVVPQLEADP